MQFRQGVITVSATDLVHHHDCHHLTARDLAVLLGEMEPPRSFSPLGALLAERGEVHEQAFINHLAATGLIIARIDGRGIELRAVDRTLDAMRDGVPLIVQGALTDGRWGGRIDVLWRVETPSRFGEWSYEAIDAKLARLTKGNSLLQLSLYSELIGAAQGVLPQRMHVVTPMSDFVPETYRVEEFAAYHRLIKARLAAAVDNRIRNTYPEPNPHCDLCRWRHPCDERRRADDHLCFVAGLSKLQIKELKAHSVDTMAELAALPLPLPWSPDRGAKETYERVREQAGVQVHGRSIGRPYYELLPREPSLGLARLPEPNRGDVFFDLEGDPNLGLGGSEYLFGYLFKDDNGCDEYRPVWAFSRADERKAFEDFVDFMMDRWARHPDLHIYHYAPYEPSALRRLMGRYASREEEVDRILRARLFVDLYPITKQALRASVESYSIKNLEALVGYARAVSLGDANHHLSIVQRRLEFFGGQDIPHETLTAVAGYNSDDCRSARVLRDWLEDRRRELIQTGETIARPAPSKGEASERVSARQARAQALMTRLLKGLPDDAEQRSPEQQAMWVMAHILGWHHRESKVTWWEFFRLADLDEYGLKEDNAGLSELKFLERVEAEKAPVDRYSFPPQETEIRGGEKLRALGGDPLGSAQAVSLDDLTIDIKKKQATADIHPRAVFAHQIVPDDALADSLLRLGEHVADHGIIGRGNHEAARDLLLRQPPRLNGEPIHRASENSLDAARRLSRVLTDGVFAIQGPPGSGKTYTGARMICEIVRSGRTVGITATSHKVIRNLLEEVVRASREEGLAVDCVQKVRSGDEAADGIRSMTSNEDVIQAIQNGAKVAGGTPWLWAPEASANLVDVLVVDEAAQISLANVLAVSQSARLVVLLGDPNQLEQPQQGSHPEGTDVSALDHILAGHQTMPVDRGLFIDETWRLHPEICHFVSEQFYEGRLKPRPGLDQQAVHSNSLLVGSGLRFVPVSHVGNQNASVEEASSVDAIVRSLLAGGTTWTDQKSVTRALELKDMLIIAPYNAQVFELSQRLPAGARVGTADRFQGQEAPIVIYSMSTSDSESAPRGMEFLYSLNRLNVAVSRARCMAVVVANPAIFEPRCQSPRQMQLANAYCRFLELATEIHV